MRLDRNHSSVRNFGMSNNIFNDDFRDLLAAFNEHEVEYILVGGYAVIVHGYNQTTGDLDLWVNATKEN